VAESRRLVHALALSPEQQAHRRCWSAWRRAHQDRAQRGHVARRSRRTPPPGVLQPARVVSVPGTPLLTETLWVRLLPLLPLPAGTGRPRGETRPLLAELLWMLHHGAGWRTIPREQRSWQTLYSRYRLWVATGVWAQITAVLRDELTGQPRT
jgi:hypothetical protein